MMESQSEYALARLSPEEWEQFINSTWGNALKAVLEEMAAERLVALRGHESLPEYKYAEGFLAAIYWLMSAFESLPEYARDSGKEV